ncbi:hypothetical protein KUTeg_005409 [Tegillarca granosa]|uniref:Laminin G domain-containing protein n=1 Tax=Tegillarca granosa TaxID=220873 RepID=A0ABQ9FP53_TEGGR|nr:hypothetical protein KUTeg_005409 [Tegillarca granosa]
MMANLVNIFLCVLFYSCVVTGTKSKLKVSSGDVFNGDKTVQNTNDRIRNEKLNFVHTQTGNYRMKSNVLHEKTCEGKDCMTKANGKSEVNARGRLRRKRKRNGHTQRKDLKVSKIASYSPSEEQRLHPSLWTSLSSLKHNMETVLFRLREKVNHDHDMLYNKTRYEVMSNVREQLKHIAEENDHAYDVVLDVSQLIRYIYLRAHNHGLMSPGPRELGEQSRIAELKNRYSRMVKQVENARNFSQIYLIPLLAKATNFTGGSTQNVVKAQIRKYERKFDEIRMLLGDDDVLKQRCEYLFELGGFSEELTPIDCEDFGIYSGSGDLPVSTMSPTTAAPSSTPRTVSTPSNSEDKDEGSATSDFEFIDSDGEKTEKPAEGGGWFFGDDPMAGNRDLFREKLQEVALSNRTKSEQIYARVEKIEMRFNALSGRWNRFLSKVDLNAKYVDLATSISHSWGDAKPYIEEIRQNIVTAHEIITKKVEKINEKLPSILQKANETLSKLQQNNTDDKSKENTGISVLQDLITAVDKSKTNMALIKNIQVAHTTPCKKVETFATQLRTNIAELRKKIEKTRDITSSMKLTISMGGEGYISVPLKSKKDLLPTTSLQMCIKPSGSDMNVAQFYDNKTAVYSVHIKDSVPIVSVYDYKGEKYGDVKGPSSLNDDQWYSIRIDRFGHTVKLSTRDMSKSLETQATMVNAFPDLIPFQNSPVAAYIGGVPQDNADDGNSQFIGCIGEMFQVLISLTEGSLHVEARTKRGTTVLRSGSGIYANGKTHHILITFGTDKIDVLTDNGTDTFLAETRTQEITSRLDSGIYLGGLGSTSQPLSGKAKLRPLVGCISHLKINENEIPMFLMEESKNAHLGSCTNNIWTQCVWFDSSSSPITLDESEDGSRIYAVVNGESQGTILQYKSGEYFDIQISLTADGINVYDALEDKNKMLQCSFHHWYILEIMDRNKKVHISCHSEKVIIGYSCGWTGFCGKMTYSLTIGGSEDGGTRLIGGILEILINSACSIHG